MTEVNRWLRKTWARYAFAWLLLVVALPVSRMVQLLSDGLFPFMAMFFAVVIAAVFAGTGPAVSIALASIAIVEFSTLGPLPLYNLILFVAACALALPLIRHLRTARAKAAEGQRANEEREAALRRERETNALLDTIFASAPIGLAFWDRELRFRRINARLAEMNGLPVAAHLGKRPDELLPKLENLSAILARWREVIATGEPWLGVEVRGETPAAPAQARTWLESFFPVRMGGEIIGLGAVVEEITDRKRAEEDLRQSEERYRAFVANSSEGIWRYELDEPLDLTLPPETQLEHIYRHARLAEANDAMARMYGYERAQQLLGAPLERMLPRDNEAAQLYLRGLIEAGFSIQDAESAERDREGNMRYFANTLMPVMQNGKLVRAWGVRRDITQSKQAQKRLREADRHKDEFLAILAHELRNPLAPIRTATQILRMSGAADSQREAAQRMIQRQVDNMVRLIDDLLDVSRITRGKLELRKTRLDIVDAVRSAIETSRPLLDEQLQALSVKLPDRPVYVEGDLTRLAQVVANLLNNAARYSPRGKRIDLTVSEKGDWLEISVKDEGIGIPEHMLTSIWEMFVQADKRLERPYGGLGIGLTLVQRLVEMHEGSVEVRSDGENRGAEFIVRLPKAQARS